MPKIKTCPFLNSECIQSECMLFDKTCAIVSLKKELSGRPYSDFDSLDLGDIESKLDHIITLLDRD
jgi:hypothetical protein